MSRLTRGSFRLRVPHQPDRRRSLPEFSTAFRRTIVGRNTIGGSNQTMVETETYVTRVALNAGEILSHIEAYLRTVNNDFVMISPVIYADNLGVPGDMVLGPQFPGSGVEFNGTDRWWPMAVNYHAVITGHYWIGVHAFLAGSLQLAFATGGLDQEVTSGGSWANEAAGSGGGLTSNGRAYSIQGTVIHGTTVARVGRLTTGGTNLALGTEVRLIPVTIPSARLLLSIEADIKVPVANVPSIRGMLYSDVAGVPGVMLHGGPWATDSWLIADTYRRFVFPMGRWVETGADYWIGVHMGDAGDVDLAHTASGGSGGNLASDTDGDTWTPQSHDYSISGTLVT